MPLDESDDERLERLVQCILDVNRIYRNKKRRRKTSKNAPNVASRSSHSKAEAPSSELEVCSGPASKHVPESNALLTSASSPTESAFKPVQLLQVPQYQSCSNNGQVWVVGYDQQQNIQPMFTYPQYLNLMNQLIYGIPLY